MSLTHRMNSTMRTRCVVLAVVSFLPVITFPLAFLFLSMSKRNRIDLVDDELRVTWPGPKKPVRLADVREARIRVMDHLRPASELRGPLELILDGGKKRTIAAHFVERPLELVRAIEARTGFAILDEDVVFAS